MLERIREIAHLPPDVTIRSWHPRRGDGYWLLQIHTDWWVLQMPISEEVHEECMVWTRQFGGPGQVTQAP